MRVKTPLSQFPRPVITARDGYLFLSSFCLPPRPSNSFHESLPGRLRNCARCTGNRDSTNFEIHLRNPIPYGSFTIVAHHRPWRARNAPRGFEKFQKLRPVKARISNLKARFKREGSTLIHRITTESKAWWKEESTLFQRSELFLCKIWQLALFNVYVHKFFDVG